MTALVRSLKKRQLAVIAAYVATSGTLGLVDHGLTVTLVALAGWLAGPFLLHDLLARMRSALGLDPDMRLRMLSFLALFFSFIGVPFLLVRGAEGLAQATADTRLVGRVRPLAVGYGVLAFFSITLSVLFPVVGAVVGPLVQLSFLGLATQFMIHTVDENTSDPVPSAGGTGHAAPVGIRSH